MLAGGISRSLVGQSQHRPLTHGSRMPKKKPSIERTIVNPKLDDPLDSGGYRNFGFPWPPYSPEMDQHSIDKWTALYNVVRSNGPCATLAERFNAFKVFHDALHHDFYGQFEDADEFEALSIANWDSFRMRASDSTIFAMDCSYKAMTSFERRLFPAVERGDINAAVAISLELGFLLCKSIVLQSDHLARAAKRSHKGAVKGTATKSSKAAERREATQQAVRERWTKNPKQSLSSIQQALAKLEDKPFGSQSLIERNTVGMKRLK